MVTKKALCCIMSLILLFGAFTLTIHADENTEDTSVSNGYHGIDANRAYLGQDVLTENIKSAFLFETNSQSLLYCWNADLPQYPASLVKIMTALLVLENTELSNTVTVSQSALDSVSRDAISADLLAGEIISVEDLLYCMIVKSANDAAAVLAEYISGTQEAFVSKMNSRAAELGCTGTTYVNAHGLHHDDQVTTARDTCRILQEALKHEFFRTAFGTVHYTVPATNLSEERIISTNNYLMSTEDVGIYLDNRVTGGRTGVTTDGFRCIASTASSGNMDVICIVMGAASTFLDNGQTDVFGGFPETITLLNRAFDGNAMRQIVFENQILRQQTVVNGDSDVFACVKEQISTVLPADYALDDLTIQYLDAPGASEAPIEKGQSLGTVQFYYNSTCIAQSEIFAANDVPIAVSKSGIYIEPEHKGFPWFILLVFVIVVAATFYLITRIISKKRRDHDRTRRK